MVGHLKSLRAFKRLIRKNPNLRPLIEQTLRQLAEDPSHPNLHTHRLKGDLSNMWSCSIDYSSLMLESCQIEDVNLLEALLEGLKTALTLDELRQLYLRSNS